MTSCTQDNVTNYGIKLIDEGAFPHLGVADIRFGLDGAKWLGNLTDSALEENMRDLSVYGIGKEDDYLPEYREFNALLDTYRNKLKAEDNKHARVQMRYK